MLVGTVELDGVPIGSLSLLRFDLGDDGLEVSSVLSCTVSVGGAGSRGAVVQWEKLTWSAARYWCGLSGAWAMAHM